jgi:hypothetical protein
MTSSSSSSLKEGLKSLGPGIITGAADDDPSGIATFSQAVWIWNAMGGTISISYDDNYSRDMCKNRSCDR